MSEPEHRPNPAVVPVFATAAFLAGLIGLWGFTSLLLNRDVIDYPDAGLLLGPSMAVAACVVTFLATMRARQSPSPILSGLLAAVVALVVILVVGAVGYSFARANFGVLPAAVVHFAISPFMIGAAILSGVVAGAAGVLTSPAPTSESMP